MLHDSYARDKQDHHKLSKETFSGVTEEASQRFIGVKSPAAVLSRVSNTVNEPSDSVSHIQSATPLKSNLQHNAWDHMI